MQTEQYRNSYRYDRYDGCEGRKPKRGPEVFYGYCYETRRMRMMDYADYVDNLQAGYANLYSAPASAMQPYLDSLTGMLRGGEERSRQYGYRCGERDCSCDCCIRCADVIEYAYCGEVRQIPITFENETRREREVKLQLSGFATEGGQEVGWNASLSDSDFTLPPCGEKTVLLRVGVECGKSSATTTETGRIGSVPACTVAYATLRSEGCVIRPVVVAVAVLPNHCGAHRVGSCGCC